MVEIHVNYLGGLHCEVTHGPSGQTFLTDAPLDNQGKAEFISPTDLAAASIGSCILTIMGISANTSGFNIDGAKVTVLKEMMNQPYRRIKKLTLNFTFPRQYSEKEEHIIKEVIKRCPVTKSLHPDIEMEANYIFNEE